MSILEKFDRLADGFSEHDYANAARYGERCAAVVCACSPGLTVGQSVLDLACGDGLLTEPLLSRGLVYRGVDASEGMVRAASARHPEGSFTLGRLEEYLPPAPVHTTVCLRAVTYPADRAAFFARVASYTRGSFVFDFRLADFPEPELLVGELRSAGFRSVALRPFLLPQLRSVPAPALPLLYGLEHAGPLARVLVRRMGRYFCAASP